MTKAGFIGFLAVGLLSACGGSGETDATASEGGLIEVHVAETPGLPAAFTRYGVESWIFEKHGLDVEVSDLQGGQTMVSALLAGDADFIGGDTVALTTFRDQGVPVVIVRPGSGEHSDTAPSDAFQNVVAGEDIESPEDLEGKKIAVNELGNITQVYPEVVLARDYGVDTSTITWVEMGIPDIPGAIASGQIDAGYSHDPFRLMAIEEGLHSVLAQGVEYSEDPQIGLVLTSEEYLSENPEVVEAFQAAHKETRDLILNDEAAFREALVELAGLQPEAAENMNLPAYHEHVNRDTLESVVQDMYDMGYIDELLDTEDFYAPGA